MKNKTNEDKLHACIGERIKALRTKNFYTQTKLGEKLGIKQSEVSRLEKGDCRTMRISILRDMSTLFNVSLDFLILGEDSDTLINKTKKLIELKKHRCVFEDAYSYPTIEINKSFFKYLFEITRANNTRDIPTDIRDSWIQKIEDEFISSSKNLFDNSQKVSYIIVPEEILNLDPNKESENQKDVMRRIQEYFEMLDLN